jgi:hypothetical protein
MYYVELKGIKRARGRHRKRLGKSKKESHLFTHHLLELIGRYKSQKDR